MSAVSANKKIVVVLGEQSCGMTLLLNRIAVKAEDAESYDLSCRISGMSMIVIKIMTIIMFCFFLSTFALHNDP